MKLYTEPKEAEQQEIKEPDFINYLKRNGIQEEALLKRISHTIGEYEIDMFDFERSTNKNNSISAVFDEDEMKRFVIDSLELSLVQLKYSEISCRVRQCQDVLRMLFDMPRLDTIQLTIPF